MELDERADRLIVAAWAGAGVCGAALLATSTFAALGGGAGPAVLVALALASLGLPAVRAEFVGLAHLPRRAVLVCGGAGLGLAALFSRRVDVFDSGNYHVGIIEWLSRFGSVPGVALLHVRLGFGSTWFALGTVFNDGFLHARMYATPGALAVVLGVAHLVVGARRVLDGPAPRSDVFLVVGLAAVLVTAPDDLLISPSPDLPAGLLIVEAAWLLLRAFEAKAGDARDAARPFLAGAVLLAAAAAGVKLQAAPFTALVVVGALVAMASIRAAVSAIIVVVGLVAPTMAYSAVTSGCPVLPAPPCLDVSWALPGSEVTRLQTLVRDFGRGTLDSPTPGGTVDWVWRRWLFPPGRTTVIALTGVGVLLLAGAAALARRRLPDLSTASLGVISGVLAVGLLSRRLGSVVLVAAAVLALLSVWKARAPGVRAVSVLALVGLAVVFAYGPLLRFALGYVALALAGFAAWVVDPAELAWARAVPPVLHNNGRALAAAMAVAALVYAPAFGRGPLLRHPNQLVLPPPVAQPQVAVHAGPGFVYRTPAGGELCWATPLPCLPRALRPDRALREPEAGIAGGFVRDATP